MYKREGLTLPTRPARPSNEDCERRKFGGVGSFGPGRAIGGAGDAGVRDFAFDVLRFLMEVVAEAEGVVLTADDALEQTERDVERDVTACM